jgi:hypothetical protein
VPYDRNPDDRLEIGYVQSSNECFRDPCLNEDWLSDLANARETITQWERTTTKSGAPAYGTVLQWR